MKKIHPPHPGEILNEEFLKPLKITQYRLARYFGTTAEFWLNLQAHYDLNIGKDKLAKKLKMEVKIFKVQKSQSNAFQK